MTVGNNEIIFFAVKDSNAIEMATEYAKKEDKPQIFENVKDAIAYLKELANKAFFHEIAHIIYKRNNFDKWEEWNKYIEEHPEIKEKVIRIQKDKYRGIEEEIPIKEEAFADFAVDILSSGCIISRLGKNKEAIDKIKAYLKK